MSDFVLCGVLALAAVVLTVRAVRERRRRARSGRCRCGWVRPTRVEVVDVAPGAEPRARVACPLCGEEFEAALAPAPEERLPAPRDLAHGGWRRRRFTILPGGRA